MIMISRVLNISYNKTLLKISIQQILHTYIVNCLSTRLFVVVYALPLQSLTLEHFHT